MKDKYKDYFETVKGNNKGVTLIGLRGWGIGGTKEHPTLTDEARKRGEHDYDDMLLVLDPEGNLGAFSQVNFEGSTLKGDVNIGGEKTTLDGENPSILDGNFTLNTVKHGSKQYDALTLNNDKKVPTGPGSNPNYPKRNPPYATEIHIHKGGSDWTWSQGCITVFSTHWDRFMSYFPNDVALGTQVGTFSLMTL